MYIGMVYIKSIKRSGDSHVKVGGGGGATVGVIHHPRESMYQHSGMYK